MGKASKVILVIIILGLNLYIIKNNIGVLSSRININNAPCEKVITYTLGSVDEKFGISNDEFLSAINDAEKIWEDGIGRDLFEYSENGKLKINLVYDVRQETTSKLEDLGLDVKNSKASYDLIRAKYNTLKSEYDRELTSLNTSINNLKIQQDKYTKDVQYWNLKGGATPDAYNSLEKQRQYLNSQSSSINQAQNNLNAKVDNLNALVSTLNDMAKSLNLSVGEYNTVGDKLPSSFEDGLYESSSEGEQKIDIYQFDDYNALVRVLTHELGHAIGLEHSQNQNSIMYPISTESNRELTQEDIVMLKNYCSSSNK